MTLAGNAVDHDLLYTTFLRFLYKCYSIKYRSMNIINGFWMNKLVCGV